MKKIFLSILILLFFLTGCVSTRFTPKKEYVSEEKIELKYPVVMVHGIARNDYNIRRNPWGRIPNVLMGSGIDVYYGNTDAWGSILSNAELLKTSIDEITEKTGCEKVNIIAHSKGGIDSRYCIWKYDYGDKVASLTTISTPHHGAEIADIIFNSKIIYSNPIKKRLQAIGKMFGDINPDIYNVNYELTTENMSEFNANITMDDAVYYQSIYTIMLNKSDDPRFSRSYIRIKSISGDNDGMVSEKSAIWGYHSVKLPDSISHDQIIDHGAKRIPQMIIPDIYLEIASELYEMGF